MTKIEAAMLAAGLFMLAALLAKMDAAAALASAAAVGPGFALIFGQEIVAHILNALGWKLAITPGMSAKIKFRDILMMRIAGDGVNYLTPSATLAGEWARAALMGADHPLEQRLSSVALAKITQTLAMAAVSAAGLALAAHSHAGLRALGPQLRNGGWLIGAIIVFIVFLEARAGGKAQPQTSGGTAGIWAKLKDVDATIMSFLRLYPARFMLSAGFFAAAYLWGAFEAYWICRFLGMAVTVKTAILIEMLAVLLDGIFFAVPGKAGTQEATKTAIFAALGYPPSDGLAFGIVRHIREIAWAVCGFALYYFRRTKTAAAPSAPPL
ncbi:MAG: lysylphosphatidylglycerol synthase transmembrane domain-containing protein [Elusimicrobiales bacterium]